MKNKKNVFLIFLILFLFNILSHYKTFSNDFVYDDQFQILENQWLTNFSYFPEIFTSSVWDFNVDTTENYYRPLMHIIFFVEYQIFGLDPDGYHFFNIFFHTVNAFLIFIILKIFLSEPWFKKNNFIRKNLFYLLFLSSLIFIVHPINSEVVYWIAAIPEIFLALFSLLLFLFFIKSKKKIKFKKYSYLFFGLALFTKETAVTLMPLLFVYSLFTRNKKNSLKSFFLGWFKQNWVYFLIFLFYFSIRSIVINDQLLNETLTDGRIILINLLFLPVIISDSIFNLIWPSSLSAIHSVDLASRNFFGFLPVIIFLVLTMTWRVLFFKNKKMLSLLKNFLFFLNIFSYSITTFFLRSFY